MQNPEDATSLRPRRHAGKFHEEMVSEIAGDRRSRRRYPIDLQLAYKVMRRHQVCRTGSGRTVNISGSGICFEPDATLDPGSPVELSIAWPVLLDDTCSLQLIVTGKVVRCGRTGTALRTQGYEFRTKGSGTLRMMTAGSGFQR